MSRIRARAARHVAKALAALLGAGALATCCAGGPAVAAEIGGTIPAGAAIEFHVLEPLASDTSKTGQAFSFELIDPIAVGDASIPAGTQGIGTVMLAGRSGNEGHEGDLTLRLDTLRLADGQTVVFDDARFEINGRNRKIASSALGFVPYAGLGALFVPGSNAKVDRLTPIRTVLARPAAIGLIDPDIDAGPVDVGSVAR